MEIIKIKLPEVKETVNALVVFNLKDDIKLIYVQNRICLYRREKITSNICHDQFSVVIEYAKNEEFDKIIEKANLEDDAKDNKKLNYKEVTSIEELIDCLTNSLLEELSEKK